MKYCPSCATGLEDNIRECPQCGHIFTGVKSESGTSQNPEKANAMITSTHLEQPPIYSVSPGINQNTDNNSTYPQQVPRWKRLLPLFIAIGVVVLMMQCCMLGLNSIQNLAENKSTYEKSAEITTEETFDVLFNVDCDENLLFNKYDVIVLIDDQQVGKIAHGTEFSFNVDLTDGKHVIKFHKDGSEAVSNTKEFDVTGASIINCEIWCKNTNVEILEFEFSDVTANSSNSSSRQHRGDFDSRTDIKPKQY